MSEKELDEFKEVTMPKNLNTPTRLDPFMKAVLEKRGHNKIISVDEEWQKVHSKLYEISGPLGMMWTQVQTF